MNSPVPAASYSRHRFIGANLPSKFTGGVAEDGVSRCTEGDYY